MLTRLELRYKENTRLEVFGSISFDVWRSSEKYILNVIFVGLFLDQKVLIKEYAKQTISR